MTMYRIYFDANKWDGQRYSLGVPGALKDIEPIADKLTEGMLVLIYMPDELEMQATLEFDAKNQKWWARPVDGTTRLLL
ncbi:MAG TPA: hypothetical protein VL625_10135 [Patescibacteria group bacterium]|nr:hypothetical protein [Patescibacteria group bacterium]